MPFKVKLLAMLKPLRSKAPPPNEPIDIEAVPKALLLPAIKVPKLIRTVPLIVFEPDRVQELFVPPFVRLPIVKLLVMDPPVSPPNFRL